MVDLNKRHEKANDRQMIILMRLADGKGHSLRELAEYFNKRAKHKMEDNNLKTSVLSGLLEEIEECTLKSLTLEVCDIKEPYSLAIKLRESNDPLAHHIRENGSQDIKRILEETKDISGFNHKSKKLTVLISGLNALLSGPSLFEEERFAHIELNEGTRRLIEQKPQGLSLFRLNRLLLEDAYPEIEKSRKSIIYVGEKRNTTRVDSLRPRQPELPYYINKDLRVFEIIVNDIRDKIGYYKCALMIANKNFRNEKERLEKEIEKLEDLEEKQNDKEKKYKLDHLRRILSGYTYFLAYLLSSAYLDDLARRFGLEYILEFIGRLEDWEPMSAFVYANSGKLKISQDFNDQLMEEISKNFSGNALARIKFRDFDDIAIPFWETTFREERDSKSQNS